MKCISKLLLFLLVLGGSVLAETVKTPEERKREFLNRPVFRNNALPAQQREDKGARLPISKNSRKRLEEMKRRSEVEKMVPVGDEAQFPSVELGGAGVKTVQPKKTVVVPAPKTENLGQGSGRETAALDEDDTVSDSFPWVFLIAPFLLIFGLLFFLLRGQSNKND